MTDDEPPVPASMGRYRSPCQTSARGHAVVGRHKRGRPLAAGAAGATIVSAENNDARRAPAARPRTRSSRRIAARRAIGHLFALFPAAESITSDMARIDNAATAHGFLLASGDYELATIANSSLLRYQITLPVNGNYPDIRKFIVQVLNDMPHAALDSAFFRRQKITDTALDAQLKFSLYVRQP